MTDHYFHLWLTVHDPQQLLEAARAHPHAASIPTEDFYQDDGEINLNFCLGTLLDPGLLPGCKIFESQCEEQNE